MKNIIIGTAGHVDHGKTLLIKALTGVDTDRLQEEKKRGITIDLGFAWLDLPDGTRAGIIDVPGHERFIKNMLAGAGGVSLALLVIAADDGVMPQTREHLSILRMLDIRDGIIVVTKADLVEAEWIEAIEEEIREEVQGTFLENAPIAVVSSYTGQGIEELRALLIERIGKAEGSNASRAFRVPVDRVFSSDGFGTVITGTLIEGMLSEGDELEIYPQLLKSRARNLQVHGHTVETAYAGQRVAINLAGIKKDDVQRGSTIALPNSMQNTRLLDVRVTALKDSRRVLKNGSRLHFYHGAREGLCRFVLLGRDTLEPGEESYAQLHFAHDFAVKRGDHFILRFFSPIETVGGGVVLDANPKKHRRNDAAVLTALRVREVGSDADTVLQALLDGSPAFLPLAEIQKRLSMENEAFRAVLEELLAEGHAQRLSAKVVIAAAYKESLGRRLQKILRDYHAANPLQAGMRRDELRGRLLPGRETQLADRVFALYAEDGLIRIIDQKIALFDFTIQYTESEKRISEQIITQFRQAEFAPPSLEEIYALHPKEKALMKRVTDALIDEGILQPTAPQMLFLTESVEKAWASLAEFAREHGRITLAEFRDIIGTSRKFALSLLEYYDRLGRTRMEGDARVLARRREV